MYSILYLNYENSNDQEELQLCSDGDGGAIITWIDWRDEDLKLSDIYAQRVDSNGKVKWNINGIPICTAKNYQEEPRICSDGLGGAIITWSDKRSGDYKLYAQRINPAGQVLWKKDGVIICTEEYYYPRHTKICDAGMGEFLIVWDDNRDFQGSNWNVYGQRIDLNSYLKWSEKGLPIFNSSSEEVHPQVCNDGLGNTIITCEDNYDISARKIDSDGKNLWGANKTIVSWYGPYVDISICPDGNGGVITTWNTQGTIYAQKINSTGVIQWTPNGKRASSVSLANWVPNICSDGSGGAIITWQERGESSNTDWDVYAQWITSEGNLQWSDRGKEICNTIGGLGPPQIAKTLYDGVIIAWSENRNGESTDIYIQKINPDKTLTWPNGRSICNEMNTQINCLLIDDGTGGVIISWEDMRNGKDWDIYAQKITSSGTIAWTSNGVPISTLSS